MTIVAAIEVESRETNGQLIKNIVVGTEFGESRDFHQSYRPEGTFYETTVFIIADSDGDVRCHRNHSAIYKAHDLEALFEVFERGEVKPGAEHVGGVLRSQRGTLNLDNAVAIELTEREDEPAYVLNHYKKYLLFRRL